jgi:hypothetical protein
MATALELQKFLNSAFNPEEREYLDGHPVFEEQLTKIPETTDGFVYLVTVGSLLLRQREELKQLTEGRRPKVFLPKENPS